jgi:hypothetical protein
MMLLCASCERAVEMETAKRAESTEPAAPETHALRFEPEAGSRYAVTLWMEREIALQPGDPDDPKRGGCADAAP